MQRWRKSHASHEETERDFERSQMRRVWLDGRRTFVRQRRTDVKYDSANRMLDAAEAKRVRRSERNRRNLLAQCMKHGALQSLDDGPWTCTTCGREHKIRTA